MFHLLGHALCGATLLASVTAKGVYEPLHHVSAFDIAYENRLTRRSIMSRETSKQDKPFPQQLLRPIAQTMTVSFTQRHIIIPTRFNARPHTQVVRS